MEPMDPIPRSESIRLWAAAAYLPAVAFFLLGNRRYRDIRLIRFHAYQAIGLGLWLVLVLLLGSLLSTLLSGLPGVDLLINLVVGLLFVIALISGPGLAFYAAYMAFQGNYTSVPLLNDWVWAQVNGSGRAIVRKRKPKRRRLSERPAPEEETY